MKLLFVNDDGIGSPFLRCLYTAAKARGHHVTVCAPSSQQSTTSHHYHTSAEITAHPLTLPDTDAAWSIDGTPVDCVRIALRSLCRNADAVLSGVNLGYNTGWPVFASGTVGAAREAVFTGVPGLAFSAEPRTPEDTLACFADWAIALTEYVAVLPCALDGVWNINAPCVPLAKVQEPVLCDLQPCIYRDDYTCAADADGTLHFRQFGLAQPAPMEGYDLALLEQGHITCTVLRPGADTGAYANVLADMPKVGNFC
ncbi:MAG: 5'/3'-nucleotidase SurE [Clostridia bacterium]|nr:5'/3'-nucleotidase SurE [Clostridia bacterium]